MFASQRVPYQQTNAFSKMVHAYLQQDEKLQPFYLHPPTTSGIQASMGERKKSGTDRKLLVEVLRSQYKSVEKSDAVAKNIEALLSENTFTITTAHQPNLFTGPLYFIYKILHAIKLSESLEKQFAACRFVPVYYMGSEDADFAELNHTFVKGKKIEWKKEQGGAVGRMTVDKTLLQLIDELEGQLGVEPHGREVISLLRECYAPGNDIQTATFRLVNRLYGKYGLIVLIPDNSLLKRQMLAVFENDLFNNTASGIIEQTSSRLEEHFNVQAHPREINLFYLKDNIRERIVNEGDVFFVNNTSLRFTRQELQEELNAHPERFSPNVILRGLYQETILPNIAFIGGGGELAYWLQLKALFGHYKVPYPVLVLRNSFLVIEAKWKNKIDRLGLELPEIFLPENEIMTQIVRRQSQQQTTLNGSFEKAQTLFDQIGEQATGIDPTLTQYVAAIKTRSLKNLQELEKKMLRAEKRKFGEQEGQVVKIKEVLFPGNGLQERVENFSGFYARWGSVFIDELLRHSLSLEQEFSVLTEKPVS